jgi:hypothetical protein
MDPLAASDSTAGADGPLTIVLGAAVLLLFAGILVRAVVLRQPGQARSAPLLVLVRALLRDSRGRSSVRQRAGTLIPPLASPPRARTERRRHGHLPRRPLVPRDRDRPPSSKPGALTEFRSLLRRSRSPRSQSPNSLDSRQRRLTRSGAPSIARADFARPKTG